MSAFRTKVSVLGAAVLLLAACSSGTSSSSPSSASSGPLAAKVAELEKAGTSYPVPTAAISGVTSLSGKTVYYIPITQQSPQFAVTQAALESAFGKVGIKLQVCNGNATPTGIAACLTQATKAKAGAIITAAIASGIPVLNTNQTADSAHPAAAKLGYIYAAGSEQMVAVADWIINDS